MSDQAKKEINVKIPAEINIKASFNLRNMFNVKALALGALAFFGTGTAISLVWGINHLNIIGLGGSTPMPEYLQLATYAAAGIAGVWNAHAIGGKTMLFNNAAITGLRNIVLSGAAGVGGGVLAITGALAATGAGNGLLLALCAGFGIAGGLNLGSLRWVRESKGAPQPPEPW